MHICIVQRFDLDFRNIRYLKIEIIIIGGPGDVVKERSTRGSVSNENNILLDPEVLTDYPTQALLLTVLVSGSGGW